MKESATLPAGAVASEIKPLARAMAVAAGLSIVGLLVVAGCLTPDPNGTGTHQQLGLPPCAWIMFWQIPCPSCGMTTSWSHLMRGDIVSSLSVNPAGTSLALIAMLLAAGLLTSGWSSRWSKIMTAPAVWIWIVAGQGLIMVLTWIMRII